MVMRLKMSAPMRAGSRSVDRVKCQSRLRGGKGQKFVGAGGKLGDGNFAQPGHFRRLDAQSRSGGGADLGRFAGGPGGAQRRELRFGREKFSAPVPIALPPGAPPARGWQSRRAICPRRFPILHAIASDRRHEEVRLRREFHGVESGFFHAQGGGMDTIRRLSSRCAVTWSATVRTGSMRLTLAASKKGRAEKRNAASAFPRR